ncbi:MAG TPA: hypothetical protein DF383_07045, partial [Deltaproteobacteria bacterium]|nr:hypothetical protein [Deltaproteobacteria bacterium]
KFLEIKLPKSKDEVEVFTCGDLSFLERLKEDEAFTAREKKNIQHQIELSESYYIPRRQWVYLANVSLNHAAEEASHFIRHLVAGEEFPRLPEDAFYAQVLHEAVGFFGSKIINPKRKCTRTADFKGFIEYFKEMSVPRDRGIELEVAHAVVEIKKHEKNGKPVANAGILVRRQELFFGVTRALGYMLGETFYHGMLQGKLPKPEIKALYKNSFSKTGEPFRIYRKLLRKLRQVSLPQRI